MEPAKDGARNRAKEKARDVENAVLDVAHNVRQFGYVRFVGTFFTIWTRRRAFGFSAEAAFWGTFTLPWLFLGTVSATSAVANWVSGGTSFDETISKRILSAAEQVLTPEAVDQFVQPLLEEVLRGSPTLSVIGLLAAIWSGSRVFATFVEGSAVVNVAGKRNYWTRRGIALTIYVLGLVSLALLVCLLIVFSDVWSWVADSLPGGLTFWVLIIDVLAMTMAMTTMMWLANPRRAKWWLAFPGGILGLVMWTFGSLGLGLYLDWMINSRSIYSVIAAPIAVMLWIFIGTIAIFAGITLNATSLVYREVAIDDTEALEHRDAVA